MSCGSFLSDLSSHESPPVTITCPGRCSRRSRVAAESGVKAGSASYSLMLALMLALGSGGHVLKVDSRSEVEARNQVEVKESGSGSGNGSGKVEVSGGYKKDPEQRE